MRCHNRMDIDRFQYPRQHARIFGCQPDKTRLSTPLRVCEKFDCRCIGKIVLFIILNERTPNPCIPIIRDIIPPLHIIRLMDLNDVHVIGLKSLE